MTKVVGILGGIGSGKSTVSRLFADLGALVLDADASARDVLALPETVAKVRAEFGDEVVGPDGLVDRSRLGRIVFGKGDQSGLARLNAIVHPLVRRDLLAKLRDARLAGRAVVILDVPLLLESPLRAECDVLLFVRASEATRRERCRLRGWDQDEIARREARQTPLAAKESVADAFIENDDDIESARRRAFSLYRDWTSSGTGDAHGEGR